MPRVDGAAAAENGVEATAGHQHRWSGVGFTFRDDHPWFQLRCACGAERSIRAWERYSEPEPLADEPMAAVDR
jgi:hypothetical protein